MGRFNSKEIQEPQKQSVWDSIFEEDEEDCGWPDFNNVEDEGDDGWIVLMVTRRLTTEPE